MMEQLKAKKTGKKLGEYGIFLVLIAMFILFPGVDRLLCDIDRRESGYALQRIRTSERYQMGSDRHAVVGSTVIYPVVSREPLPGYAEMADGKRGRTGVCSVAGRRAEKAGSRCTGYVSDNARVQERWYRPDGKRLDHPECEHMHQ